MAEERVHRRLAAILAADTAGYSRLMGEDEAGTLARFNEQLDGVVRPAVDDHGGRLVKTMGDGFLVEFGSVLDAVQCAADIQDAVAQRECNQPDDQRMLFRIGVHLGDVIVEGEDIHGEGVNIAARLEQLAPPGGICVSDMVHAGVRNKLTLGFTDLGERSVKNIADPVHVFQALLDAPPKGAAASNAIFRRPAVAVLPFDNLSGDPEQEYFSDGLTEDIITALSLWRTFPVIARNSTFTYKGRAVKVQEVARELGAPYVIEGSVRKSGERVRVAVQLIDAGTGHHVWAERYDRRIDDIFALQDEITERIATTVAPELERAERQRAASKQPNDLRAWDYYLRGLAFVYDGSKRGSRQARDMFERAVALDPTYSRGYSGLAYSHSRDAMLAYSDDIDWSIAQCLEAAQRAVSLDDTDPSAHFALSRGLHYAGRIDEALLEAKLVTELNPNEPLGYASLGHILIAAGRSDEGIAALRRARQLSPKDPRTYMWLGMESYGHMIADRSNDAAAAAKDALDRHPGDPGLQILLVASLGNAGRTDEARSVLIRCEPIDRRLLDDLWFLHRYNAANRARLLDGLRKAGWQG